MILLFDQNLSFKIVQKVKDIFPGSKHLSDLNLENNYDLDIWKYAKENNYCIVTFDSDFIDLSTLRGFPPKIIWLRMGNTSTENIATKLTNEFINIKEFLESKENAFLEIK